MSYFKHLPITNILLYNINIQKVTGGVWLFFCEICHEKADIHHIVHRHEGGFDIEEINIFKNSDSNIYFVSLGNRILRAETAVINLLSVVMYEFDR